MATKETRVRTGCAALDKMLDGGFLPASAVLLEGAAGTGKTTLGLQFLMEGIRRKEHGLLVTFEEYPEQYCECALELGWDLRQLEAEGKLDMIFSTPEDFLEKMDDEHNPLLDLMGKKHTRRVVIDSVTHLERLAKKTGDLRRLETEVVNFFKQEGCTNILLKENPNILGGWNTTANKIAFVADCYLLLRYVELESEVKRGLMILKMRGSAHDRSIQEYEIGKGGLEMKGPFHGISGIFLGTGVRTRGA